MPKYRLLIAAAATSLLASGSIQAFAQAPAAAPAPAAPAAPAPAAPTALVPAATAPTAPAAKLAPLGDSASTLRASADFTTLVKALDATNLASLIQTRPGMTLFAPTNAAFAALPAGKLDAMLAATDKAPLQKLLLHHIINAKIDSSKIKGARGPLPTGAGDRLVLDGSAENGVFKADNATISQLDITTSNGTIHVVDNVLIAGSVPEALAPPPEPEAAPAPEPTPAKGAPKPAAKKAPAKKKK